MSKSCRLSDPSSDNLKSYMRVVYDNNIVYDGVFDRFYVYPRPFDNCVRLEIDVHVPYSVYYNSVTCIVPNLNFDIHFYSKEEENES